LRCQRADSALRSQHSAFGLEQDEGEVVAAKGRIQARGARDVQTLGRDAVGGKRPLRLRLPAVLAMGEPGEAALDEQLLARLPLELASQRPRAASHRGVLNVGPMGAAIKPRFATGGGPGIAGLELINQRDAFSAA
jgi:hypothetical protein